MTTEGRRSGDQNELVSFDAKLLNVKLEGVQSEMKRLGDETANINRSLMLLARLEQDHIGIQGRLKDGAERFKNHDARLQVIEVNMPALLELRKWVIGGMLAGLGMVGAALFKLALVDPGKTASVQIEMMRRTVAETVQHVLAAQRQTQGEQK